MSFEFHIMSYLLGVVTAPVWKFLIVSAYAGM